MPTFPIYIALTVIPFIWAAYSYNRFIRLGRLVDEAWSGIAVQLRRRHDLIPNLVEAVKAYASHEKTVLTAVTELRNNAATALAHQPAQAVIRSEGQLQTSLDRLLVIAESYPALTASENFMALHKALIEVEDHIQLARRYYNGTVRNHAILVESFPSLLIARLFSFQTRPFFALGDEAEGAAPSVQL